MKASRNNSLSAFQGKVLMLSLLACLTFVKSNSQILNGSFENGLGPDLTNWQWTCGYGVESFNDAPLNGGSWCIKVNTGSSQGCMFLAAYQKIPGIENGSLYELSCWAYTMNTVAHLMFGKINNGVITTFAEALVFDTVWTYTSVQSSFQLSIGDTAAVVLYSGVYPSALGIGYFDLINLKKVTGVTNLGRQEYFRIVQNPLNSIIIIESLNENLINHCEFNIINLLGQNVFKGRITTTETIIQKSDLPKGIYFIRIRKDSLVLLTKKLLVN